MDSQTKTKAVNLEDLQISVREVFNKGFGNSGTCATAADTPAKEVTLGTIFSLVNGCTLLVKFTNGITSENSTLAVTHTVDGASVTEAAKPIYLNGAYVDVDAVPAGAVLILRYNGSQFEIVGGAGVNSGSASGSSYTPTLSDTPTESTLTYTKDGKTYAFEIGQFCRVADASAPLGYKFYQLFDIAQNGTVAKWNAYATKIPSEYTAPTPKTLAYNTEAQALLNVGSSDDGTIQYSSDGTNWSTTIPTGTDAGTYNVYWRLNGDAQHQDVQPTQIAVTIAPKEVASPTITLSEDSYTYDGTEKEPIVTAKDGDDVIPSTDYTVTYSNNTNAGTATVEVEDNGGNYAFEGSVTFTISKANGSVTTIPASRGVTYNGNAQIVADAGVGTGTMMYRFGDTGEFSSSIPTLTDAGEYTLYYYAAESENYEQSQTGNIAVSVFKAAPMYSSPSAKSLTYSGSAQDLLNAGSTNDGTIQYSGDGGTTWSTTIPQGTNAGNYTPQWKLVGDANHTDVAAQTINVNIAKANPTYTAPTAKNLTYDSTAQDLLNAGTTSDGTISYSSDGETWGSTIPQGTNAIGYTVYWKLTGDANHNDVAPTAINVSIAKVTPTVTAPTTKTGLTYNTQAQELLNAGSTNWGTLKYSSDGTTYGTTIPSGTNAGTYTLYYKVEGDSNINDVAPVELSVTIAKIDPTYTAPTAKSLSPTGSAQDLVNAGSTSDGTFSYSLDNEKWSTSIPQGTDAGFYTVYWKLIGDINHNDVASTIINVIVATITAPTAKSGLVYNGTAQELVNVGSTDFGTLQYSIDNETWGTTVPSATNAGDYSVFYRIAFDGNYGITSSVSCSIAKANREASFFDANGHDYVEIGGLLWATKNVGANSPTDFGNYYMLGKGSTTYNSSDSAYSGTETPLSLSVDTARQVMGGSWRMPTIREYTILTLKTTSEYTTINGVGGMKFTSNNGNTFVFFPFAGFYSKTGEFTQGKGRYWSSNQRPTSSEPYGSIFRLETDSVITDKIYYRNGGLTIRGVIEPYPQKLHVGDSYTVQVYTNGSSITLSSSNTSVATVSGMTVTAVGGGNTTITATIAGDSNYNSTTISFTVTILSDLVDMGLPSGTKWASGNIVRNGNSYKIGKEYEAGAYISWGNIDPHFLLSDEVHYENSYNWGNSNTSSPYKDSAGSKLSSSSYPNHGAVFAANSGHDVARQLLGNAWRLPTYNEFDELFNNSYTFFDFKNNALGVTFLSKNNGNEIFFPRSGSATSGGCTFYKNTGQYWTCSLESAAKGCILQFYSDGGTIKLYGYSRFTGCVVRAVK